MNKIKQTGVTLIELLIVLVVVSIIAAFAIPNMLSAVVKGQVASAIPLSEQLRAQVSDYYTFNGAWPTARADLGLGAETDTSSEFVESILVSSGSLIASFRADANANIAGLQVVFHPMLDADQNISWSCSPAPAPAGMTIEGDGISVTTVGSQYMPRNCQ